MKISKKPYYKYVTIKSIHQYFFLLFFLLVIGKTQGQLVHPGISHKLSDLERMKDMVEAGIEPWATAFKELSSQPRAQYDMRVDVVNQDPSYVLEYSSNSKNWFVNDGTTAYYNALMWYITRDVRHAEKAIEVFNTYKGLRRNTTSIPLESGRVWRIIEAAEIIKSTYSGWSSSDIQEFKDMLVYPGWSPTTVPTKAIEDKDFTFYWHIYNGDPARHGNQGLFDMRTMMAMGIFLDNEIIYDRALRYLQGLPHRSDDLEYPSGPSINSTSNKSDCDFFEEFNRDGQSNAITDYGYNEVMSNYIFENGQSQESSRDQAHALAGVITINIMAEMAWNQGDDLYGHLENRPLKGMEFFIRYNLSSEVSYPDQTTPWEPTLASGEYIERTDRSGRWRSLKINPGVNCDQNNVTRGENNLKPIYEMSLAHYKDRLDLPSEDFKWLKRGHDYFLQEIGIEEQGTITDHPAQGTLAFRRVSPGDPINGFDEEGLPKYVLTKLPRIIEAENYDYFTSDGNSHSYQDSSEGNSGNVYRNDESVDLKEITDGNYAITDIELGEWLNYTVSVPSSGTYDISITYASNNNDGTIKFNISGDDLTSTVAIPHGSEHSTGLTDWKTFKVASEIQLSKGVQPLKVYLGGVNQSFELDNIDIALVEADKDPVNLAVLYGEASQSSNRPDDGFAINAIDGNTNGAWSIGSVSHTGGNSTTDPEPWWQVNLKNNYNIETIGIHNRTDNCCSSRLNNITVEVLRSSGDVTFSKFYETIPSSSFTVDTGGVIGDVVRVSKTSSTAMTLAEVEVYGIDRVITLSNIEKELENKISLYPNPSSGLFTISNSIGYKINIYNTVGVHVVSKVIKTVNETIDLSSFSNGVYFVEISNFNGTITKKIIKE